MKHLKNLLSQPSAGKASAAVVGQPSAHRRYSRLKHLALMLCFLLGSLNAWGTSPASITFSEKSLTNAQEYTDPFAIDDKVSVTFGSGGKYYNTGQAMRVYANGTMTISGGEGVTITAISITIGSSSSGSFTASEGTYDNGSWSGSASSITFTRGSGSGHIRVPSIEVTYTTGGPAQTGVCCEPVMAHTDA